MTASGTASRGRTVDNGQWALGQQAALNANEQFKQDDNPLNVRERLIGRYASEGFASIDPDDLRGRLRWWGLYTQRKPGIDGGRTTTLEPHELEDEHFMMRIRVDGGQLDLDQLRAIGRVSQRYGRDTADVTDRQNIQLHWVRVEDVPAIWDEIESVGLTTVEACGDCPRVLMGSPVAGIAEDEVIDPTEAIGEIVRRYVGDPDLANLPRKFKTSISWLADTPYLANDFAMLGVIHPEHGPGFDLWVGGGLSTNPMLAQRLGVWVPLHEIAEVWVAVVRLFRDYGYRRLRNRARLKFLVADWGVERFRQVLETEFLGRSLVDGPAAELPERPIDHVGVHRQWDGKYYVGVAPVVGRVSGEILQRLADIAEAHGSARVRLTPYQKLIVCDVPQESVASLVVALREIGLEAEASVWRRSTMACTGIEYCKLAIVETKATATRLVERMEQVAGDLDTPISINVNGCPNSCARTQVADIGLRGQLVPDEHGRLVEGFQVHLGGALGMDSCDAAGFGRKPRGLKVTAEQLPAYVASVTGRYLDGRAAGESFASWARRCEESQLLRGED